MKTINAYIASVIITLVLVLSMLGIGLDALSVGRSGTANASQITTAQASQDLAQR